jgi:hypothetical protein
MDFLPSVLSASATALADTFDDLNLIDLIITPGFGLGQPGNGKGVLAGAVPTAETVINGFVQITPQLMSLGYATGREIFPDHTGVYPPTDRMSLLTCGFINCIICCPNTDNHPLFRLVGP